MRKVFSYLRKPESIFRLRDLGWLLGIPFALGMTIWGPWQSLYNGWQGFTVTILCCFIGKYLLQPFERKPETEKR